MKIIHLISDLSGINFGIWNAALGTAAIISDNYKIKSEVWSPDKFVATDEAYRLDSRQINPKKALNGGPKDNVFVSHGSWTWATKVGYHLKARGYKWIAIPHGMLEPWSMNHKKWKKRIYFSLYEKRMLRRADAIVAVGGPEYDNLKRMFGEKVVHIPNGIMPYAGELNKADNKRIFLFMGRLHHKKGVLPLVQAWLGSRLASDPTAELWIAGPDEGELEKIKAELERRKANVREEQLPFPTSNLQPPTSNLQPPTSNVQLLGPVYGQEKEEILRQAHYFVLPSQSEGFPTSIIESMTYGCVPVITAGCNFPEAIESKVAIPTDFDVEEIMQSLEYAAAMREDEFSERSGTAKNFADSHYNLERIAEQQFKLYERVLKS